MREVRGPLQKKTVGLLGSFVVGATFAFGWTPCIGPILAGILAYAGTQATLGQGILLLAFYSLGLGVPFLLAAWGIHRFFGFLARIKKWLPRIEMASGILLILIGILIFTNRLSLLTGYFGFLNRFSM
jgi:cytochrome c-type biogenesis protein